MLNLTSRRALLILLLVPLLVVLHACVTLVGRWDAHVAAVYATCARNTYQRQSNPDTLSAGSFVSSSSLRWALLQVGVPLYVLSLALRLVWRHRPQARARVTALAQLGASIAAYYAAVALVHGLRRASGDMECASVRRVGEANGVSGHTFYMTALLVCHNVLLWRGAQNAWERVTGPWIVAAVVVFQAWITWSYGYHSLQQMVFGCCAGLLWSAGVVWVVELSWRCFVHGFKKPRTRSGTQATLLGAKVASKGGKRV